MSNKGRSPPYGSAYSNLTAAFNPQNVNQEKMNQAFLDSWGHQKMQQSYHHPSRDNSQYISNFYPTFQQSVSVSYSDPRNPYPYPTYPMQYYEHNNRYADSTSRSTAPSYSASKNETTSDFLSNTSMTEQFKDYAPKVAHSSMVNAAPPLTINSENYQHTLPQSSEFYPSPPPCYSTNTGQLFPPYAPNQAIPPQKKFKMPQTLHGMMSPPPANQSPEGRETPPQDLSYFTYPYSRARINIPDGLRRYVKRCFDFLKEPTEIGAMQERVNAIIYQAIQANIFYTCNWDDVPVPRDSPPIYPFGDSCTSESKPSHSTNFSNDQKVEAAEVVQQNDQQQDIWEKKKLQRHSRFSMNFNKKPWKQTDEHDAKCPGAIRLPSSRHTLSDNESNLKKFVGTCTDLEKKFLRLTTVPDPSTVRPEYILRKSLEMVKKKVQEGVDLIYIWEQMKSIRLDLTTQDIKNEFTVEVYELHARICLEYSDIVEFNRCQGILRDLYRLGIPGNVSEFTAYRLLYTLHAASIADLNGALTELTPAQRKNHEVRHAIMLCEAFIVNNWVKFFKLVRVTPHLDNYLIFKILDKVRLSALEVIFRAFSPIIPVSWLSTSLGYSNVATCKKFLADVKCAFSDQKEDVLCKESAVRLAHYVANIETAK